MGIAINDYDTFTVLAQLNFRFGEGDAITEIAALHKTFQIFTPRHTLREAFALLGIGPMNWLEKQRWYKFLDSLKKYKSDVEQQNGHDRIISALAENLESKNLLPVFFTTHSGKGSSSVLVSVGSSVVFIRQEHLTISIPTTPRGYEPGSKTRRGARGKK